MIVVCFGVFLLALSAIVTQHNQDDNPATSITLDNLSYMIYLDDHVATTYNGTTYNSYDTYPADELSARIIYRLDNDNNSSVYLDFYDTGKIVMTPLYPMGPQDSILQSIGLYQEPTKNGTMTTPPWFNMPNITIAK